MDRPKHRRFILLGIALVAGTGLLLLGRQWISTTESTPVPPQATAQQVVAPTADPPPIAEASTPEPVADATAAAPSGFRGRVVDAVTRQPVKEFEIELLEMQRPDMPGKSQAKQTFRSADGRFAWQQAPVGTWGVRVAAPHYQQFRIESISIAAGKATREIVMPLQPGHILKGRVFDEVSGAGIADASVSFRDPAEATPDFWRKADEQSKKDGTFVIDGVPGGTMIVRAAANNYAGREITVKVSTETPPVEIGLTTGGKIAGMVVAPDGTPVKGTIGLAGPGLHHGALLDETGAFNFTNRPAGRYKLTAHTDAGNASLDIELAENEVREDIVLKVGAGRSVRGVVKGLRPEQFERTYISVHSESKRSNFVTRPDEQGAYAVKGVPPGRAQVSVNADMSRHTTKVIDMPEDKDLVLDIVFPPGARVSGHVTQGAKPAAGRIVWVGPPRVNQEAGSTGYSASTAPDGRYDIEGVPAGEYRISVDRDASRLITIAGDTVVNIDIPVVQIGGRVFEDGGTVPVVGAGVHVIGIEPQTSHVRNYKEVDDFGHFQLVGIDPGEILLTVHKPGYEMYREKIAYSSPLTNRTITLRKSTGVEVRLQFAPNGPQIERFFVTEKLPGTDYGIGLWVPVNSEGVAYLPDALAGSGLTITGLGGKRFVVEKWDGQPLDLKL
jgi:Carboxypeptidase regulatory-like domain